MKKRKNAGMSLIEVIVAVAIFAITAAVVLQSFVTDKPQIEDLSGGDYSSPEYHERDQGQNL